METKMMTFVCLSSMLVAGNAYAGGGLYLFL
jgi:hypothetical protein